MKFEVVKPCVFKPVKSLYGEGRFNFYDVVVYRCVNVDTYDLLFIDGKYFDIVCGHRKAPPIPLNCDYEDRCYGIGIDENNGLYFIDEDRTLYVIERGVGVVITYIVATLLNYLNAVVDPLCTYYHERYGRLVHECKYGICVEYYEYDFNAVIKVGKDKVYLFNFRPEVIEISNNTCVVYSVNDFDKRLRLCDVIADIVKEVVQNGFKIKDFGNQKIFILPRRTYVITKVGKYMWYMKEPTLGDIWLHDYNIM